MVIPRRVFRDNQLRSNEVLDHLLSMIKTDGASFSLHSEIPSKSEAIEGFGKYYYFMHRLITSAYESIPDRFARMETRVRQARRVRTRAFPHIVKDSFPDSWFSLFRSHPAGENDIHFLRIFVSSRVSNLLSLRCLALASLCSRAGLMIGPAIQPWFCRGPRRRRTGQTAAGERASALDGVGPCGDTFLTMHNAKRSSESGGGARYHLHGRERSGDKYMRGGLPRLRVPGLQEAAFGAHIF